MRHLVIACSECGRARVLQEGPATTQCPNCGRRAKVENWHVWGTFNTAEEARTALGRVNAAAAGDPGAVEAYAELRAELEPRPRDGIDRALARAREATGRTRRSELAAEGLTAEFDTWDEAQFLEAADRLNIPPEAARDQLRQMVAAGVVVEPRHGVYRVA